MRHQNAGHDRHQLEDPSDKGRLKNWPVLDNKYAELTIISMLESHVKALHLVRIELLSGQSFR